MSIPILIADQTDSTATTSSNLTVTENGDKAFVTSGQYCLDFFVKIVRNAPIDTYISQFTEAWKEDKSMCYQILMNLRDVRKGKGEKLIPTVLMTYLKHALGDLVLYECILHEFVKFGYWKDILKIAEISTYLTISLDKKNHPSNCDIELKLFKNQLETDIDALNTLDKSKTGHVAISLCAKWAPTENTHFDKAPLLFAKKLARSMNFTMKTYRQTISKLRSHIVILENLMATQQYDKIDFSKLPSIALSKHKKSFSRDHNSKCIESKQRKKLHLSYNDYLVKLRSGKAKVNTTGIEPHDLVKTYYRKTNLDLDILVEEQWKKICNSVKESGSFDHVTAVVDVSGSMEGIPMLVSIALGLLVAECTTEHFAANVITFHENPTWYQISGDNLRDKVHSLSKASWGGSTNLRKVFDIILEKAQNSQLEPDLMIKTLFIFTDMQFDSAVGATRYRKSQLSQNEESSMEYGKRRFEECGYSFPKIICWNLRTSSANSLPLTKDENGYVMISGFSAELMKSVMTGEDFTPISMLKHVLEPYIVPEFVSRCNSDLALPFDLSHLKHGVDKSKIKKVWKKNDTNTTNTIHDDEW